MSPSSVPGFPGLHVGDRVRIVSTYYDTEIRNEGRIGVVSSDSVERIGGRPVVLVANDPASPDFIFTYATSVEKVAPEPEAPGLSRVEAAKVAGSILASDASVAEIVELARYLEGSPQPSSAAAPVLTLAQARELVADGFSSRGARVRVDRTADSDVLDLSSGYIRREHMEDFIQFCRAAVIVHDASRPVPTPSVPTPF